jgi:hypothetical protein
LFNTPNSLKYLEISILGFSGGFDRNGSINNIYFMSKKKSFWLLDCSGDEGTSFVPTLTL